MSRFSRPNRQIHRDQDGYPSKSVNFFSLADWSCVGSSVNEDFVHPSFAVQSPKFNTDPQKSSKHDIHHCSYGNVRSPTQSESTEDEDSSKAKETLTGRDSHSSNHRSKHITSFFSKIPFKGYSDGFDNRSSVVHSRVGRTASSSKSAGHSQASSAKVEDTVLCCDKCDARHETEDCPYYKKKREIHLDGQKNGWKLVGGSSNLPGRLILFMMIEMLQSFLRE
jgi:hypothetical protein